MVRTAFFAALSLVVTAASLPAQTADAIPAKYAAIANRIIAAAQADSAGAWNRIAELTDRFGHRLSGSMALEQAIDWTVATMSRDGLNLSPEQVRAILPGAAVFRQMIERVNAPLPREAELALTFNVEQG